MIEYVPLPLVYVELAHLLAQLVVERVLVTVHHLLVLGIVSIAGLVRGGHLIVGGDALEGLVYVVGPLAVVIGGRVAVIVHGIGGRVVAGVAFVGRGRLERRVVVELGVDVLFELCHRHLGEPYEQHLLLCEALLLQQFLFLGLY